MGLELRIITDEATNAGFTLDIKQDEDFPFTLNLGIADIENIAKTKSTFSKTFKIPATAENNKNLESIYYSSTSDDGNAKKNNVCVVVEDGVPITKGFLKIKNVLDNAEKGREYEAVYFGDNFGWIKYFRETSLQDLDFSSENHIYNATNVEASWVDSGAGTTGATSDDRSYVYPVISYGAFSGNEVQTTDLRPAMFVKSILDKAWDSVSDNYSYNISSTFLDGTLAKSLIMPFTTGEFTSTENKQTGEDFFVKSDQVYTLNIYSDDDSVDPTAEGYEPTYVNRRLTPQFNDVEYGNTLPAGGRSYWLDNAVAGSLQGLLNEGNYTIRIKGVLEFTRSVYDRVRRKVNPNFNIILGNYYIYEDTPIITKAPEIEFYWNVIVAGETRVFSLGTWTPSLDEVTDTFELDSEITLENLIPDDDVDGLANCGLWIGVKHEYGVSAFNLDWTSGGIKINKNLDVILNQTVNLANTLPDVKISQLYQGLAHNFNLYADTNEFTREITVEPRDDFYGSFADAVNWTDKVDYNMGYNIEYVDIYNRTLEFRYKPDSGDRFMTKYETANDIKVGGGEVDLSERFNEGTTVLENPFFSATMHNRVVLGAENHEGENDKKHIVPVLWANIGWDDEPPAPSYSYAPRLLTYSYETQTDGNGANITWVFNGDTKTNLPTGFFTDTVADSSIDNANLHYGGANGLIDNYYGSRLALLNEGVRVYLSMNLNKNDIQQLDLSRLVYISAPSKIAGYYAIEKIVDYKPSSRSTTKVVLQKVVDVKAKIKAKDKWHEKAVEHGGLGDTTSEGREFDWDRKAWEASNQNERIEKYIKDLEEQSPKQITDFADDGTTKHKYDAKTIRNNKEKSFELKNGNDNIARPNSGSIAMGEGAIALGPKQTAMGSYNAPSVENKFMIGGGANEQERLTVFSIDKNGVRKDYGGKIYTRDANGNIVPVITRLDGEYEEVYLKKDSKSRG